jgi:REP element-mobilizing transposase RayT
VHILFKSINNYKAQNIVGSWKSYTANIINKKLGTKGQLWAHESYDHIVRNVEEFFHIRNYIANNPIKAGTTVSHIKIGGR